MRGDCNYDLLSSPHALKRRESIKKFLRRRGPMRRRLHATVGAQKILCELVKKYSALV
jgi:hypothetical protein